MNINKTFLVISLASVAAIAVFFYRIEKKIDKMEFLALKTFEINAITLPQYVIGKELASKDNNKKSLCPSLKNVPMSDRLGIITDVKTIHLQEVKTPYNASIIQYKDGYLMFFRHDVLEPTAYNNNEYIYKSFVAGVTLDKNFHQISPVKNLDTKSTLSQDPRVFISGEKYYLVYNDVTPNTIFSRQMHLAHIDVENMEIVEIINLDQNIQPIEKNWVPFNYITNDGKQNICFEYSLNPHKILQMQNNTSSQMQHLVAKNCISYQRLPWLKRWGQIRGGTPAILVDGEYLSFFHSSFKEDKKRWYVIGAYTFEKDPPFRIISMSEYPILFETIYDTPASNTSTEVLRCIFPSGVVLDKQNNRDVFHVSCGENDCAVKIITIDKKSLYNSLIPVPLMENN